jgi:hypothetical protein
MIDTDFRCAESQLNEGIKVIVGESAQWKNLSAPVKRTIRISEEIIKTVSLAADKDIGNMLVVLNSTPESAFGLFSIGFNNLLELIKNNDEGFVTVGMAHSSCVINKMLITQW